MTETTKLSPGATFAWGSEVPVAVGGRRLTNFRRERKGDELEEDEGGGAARTGRKHENQGQERSHVADVWRLD